MTQQQRTAPGPRTAVMRLTLLDGSTWTDEGIRDFAAYLSQNFEMRAAAAEQSVPLDVEAYRKVLREERELAVGGPSTWRQGYRDGLEVAMRWLEPDVIARLVPARPADAALPTDEQAESWLQANDLYAVTHLHEPPEDCAECNAVTLAASPDPEGPTNDRG